MSREWIIRAAIAIVAHAVGVRNKEAAVEQAARDGLEAGVQLYESASVHDRFNNIK